MSMNLVARFHQTPVSKFVKNLPLVAPLARQWWIRTQAKAFFEAFEQIRLRGGTCIQEADERTCRGFGEPPAVETIRRREDRTRVAGEAFKSKLAMFKTSKFHDMGYQEVYGPLVEQTFTQRLTMLEIGIGVSDPSARSGMGYDHRPGESLRGWRYLWPDAEIHGADVDKRVLTSTPWYQAHWADQLDLGSLVELAQSRTWDLVVDDGLHTPAANANVCLAFLPNLSPCGLLVIEDIDPIFDGLWSAVSEYLLPRYRLWFYPSTILKSNRPVGHRGSLAVIRREPST